MAVSANIGSLYATLTLNARAYQAELRQAQQATRAAAAGMNQAMMGAGAGMAMSFYGVTSALNGVAASIGGADRAFRQYENTLVRISTVTGRTVGSMNALVDSMRNVAVQSATSMQEFSTAMYRAAQATFTQPRQMRDIAVTAGRLRAASGGEIGMRDAADSLSVVYNALGIKPSRGGAVSDIMLKGRNIGRWELGQMVDVLSRPLAVAGSMQRPGANPEDTLRDLLSVLATVTQGGVSRNIAGTGVRRAYERTNLLTMQGQRGGFQGMELMRQWKSRGFDTPSDALRQLGLVEYLLGLQQMTGGSAEQLGRLGYGSREMQVMTSAIRGGGAPLRAMRYQEMGDTEGLTDRYMRTREQQYEFKRERLAKRWENLQVKFGEAALPVLETFVAGLGKLLDVLSAINPMLRAAVLFAPTAVVAAGMYRMSRLMLTGTAFGTPIFGGAFKPNAANAATMAQAQLNAQRLRNAGAPRGGSVFPGSSWGGTTSFNPNAYSQMAQAQMLVASAQSAAAKSTAALRVAQQQTNLANTALVQQKLWSGAAGSGNIYLPYLSLQHMGRQVAERQAGNAMMSGARFMHTRAAQMDVARTALGQQYLLYGKSGYDTMRRVGNIGMGTLGTPALTSGLLAKAPTPYEQYLNLSNSMRGNQAAFLGTHGAQYAAARVGGMGAGTNAMASVVGGAATAATALKGFGLAVGRVVGPIAALTAVISAVSSIAKGMASAGGGEGKREGGLTDITNVGAETPFGKIGRSWDNFWGRVGAGGKGTEELAKQQRMVGRLPPTEIPEWKKRGYSPYAFKGGDAAKDKYILNEMMGDAYYYRTATLDDVLAYALKEEVTPAQAEEFKNAHPDMKGDGIKQMINQLLESDYLQKITNFDKVLAKPGGFNQLVRLFGKAVTKSLKSAAEAYETATEAVNEAAYDPQSLFRVLAMTEHLKTAGNLDPYLNHWGEPPPTQAFLGRFSEAVDRDVNKRYYPERDPITGHYTFSTFNRPEDWHREITERSVGAWDLPKFREDARYQLEQGFLGPVPMSEHMDARVEEEAQRRLAQYKSPQSDITSFMGLTPELLAAEAQMDEEKASEKRIDRLMAMIPKFPVMTDEMRRAWVREEMPYLDEGAIAEKAEQLGRLNPNEFVRWFPGLTGPQGADFSAVGSSAAYNAIAQGLAPEPADGFEILRDKVAELDNNFRLKADEINKTVQEMHLKPEVFEKFTESISQFGGSMGVMDTVAQTFKQAVTNLNLQLAYNEEPGEL
ncbi:MAG: phage tail tape measure protein [Kiritimatiellaeota bacterium]|nr:phage tail tape measure protein [Kiritimatiellota bacterium]